MENCNINVKIGCDIVKVRRFDNIKKNSLLKIFHENEISDRKSETVAGLFAAKESCRKVFNKLEWHDIMIKRMRSGKPSLSIDLDKIGEVQIVNCDLSISHDGDYAIAMAVFLVKYL